MTTITFNTAPRAAAVASKVQTQVARTADAWAPGAHLAMIRRFFKFVLGVLLFMAVVTAIMAVRVIAWFPHFHQ